MIKWLGPLASIHPLKGGSVSTVTKGLFSILLFLPRASSHTPVTPSQRTHTEAELPGEPDIGRNITNHRLTPL